MATYLTAHFAKSLVWHSSILLFAFYLTEACGLRPAMAGALLGVSLVVNGLTDLAVGILKDRTITDGRGAARFQQAGAIVVAASFAAFCAASLLPDGWRLPVAIASLMLFRLSYPIVDVAQNALLSLADFDDIDRYELVAWRFMTGGVAILVIATLVAPALVLDDGTATARFAITGAILAGFLLLSSSRLRIGPSPRPPVSMVPADTGSAFPAGLAIVVLTGFSGTVFRKLEAYYAAFANVGAGPSMTLMIAVAVGNLASQPGWLLCQRRCGTATTIAASAAVTLLAGAAFLATMRPGVALPADILFGIGSGGNGLALWGIVAILGARGRPMLRFGAFTCLSKLAQGAGAAAMGILLSRVDYRHVIGVPGNALVRTMIVAPMASAVACIVIVHALRRQLK